MGSEVEINSVLYFFIFLHLFILHYIFNIIHSISRLTKKYGKWKNEIEFSYIIITHDSTNGLWKFVKFRWLDEWQDVDGSYEWGVVNAAYFHPPYTVLFFFNIILHFFNTKFNWHLFCSEGKFWVNASLFVMLGIWWGWILEHIKYEFKQNRVHTRGCEWIIQNVDDCKMDVYKYYSVEL